MIVDVSLLPESALVDTGVFFRGILGDRPNEQISGVCKDFCDAMIDNARTIFVAAPTIAEVTRYNGKRVPHQKGIVVVPFDERAAEKLGLSIPMAKICEAKDARGFSKTYLKYDSLIAACAMRASAHVLVALDSDHTEMAQVIGMRVMHPQEFEKKKPRTPKQRDLFDRIAEPADGTNRPLLPEQSEAPRTDLQDGMSPSAQTTADLPIEPQHPNDQLPAKPRRSDVPPPQ